MSTHTKAKTRRQWRHPASRSVSHQEDKRQGDRRRETDWIGVDAPERPSPKRSFGPIQGHEYTYERGKWHRCETPEEFADFLEYEARRRNWYRDQTSRKGVPVTMTRRVAAPLEILTTTFSPWLSDHTAAQVAAGRDPRPGLAKIRNGWLQAAQRLLGQTRWLLGYAFHADTDDLHFDLVLSRQDGNGGRIGEAGLKLVGPWSVGCDRQVRAGADIHPDKRRQLRRGIANFRRRYGEEAVPVDVALARALDTAADDVLGDELRPYREAYAKRVPKMERQHTAARLAVVEAAKAQLLERTSEAEAPKRPYTPLPPLSGPQPEPDFPSLG